MVDFDIDVTGKNSSGFDKLEKFCDTFNLKFVIPLITIWQLVHFSPTNQYVFKESLPLKLD